MTNLYKLIVLEANCATRANLDRMKPQIKRGYLGVIKGNSLTYRTPSGAVQTKKLSEVTK